MINRLCLSLCVLVSPLGARVPPGHPAPLPRIHANQNDHAAGSFANGVLTVRLEARLGLWHPEAETGMGIAVQAFAEEGKPLEDPGPLIRVPQGTEIRVTIRNAILGKTLVVHGLGARPGVAADSLVIAPGAVVETRFLAGAPGTYFYWATTTGVPIGNRRTVDSQLTGALIVDPAGTRPADRVFVIGVWLDSLTVAGVPGKHEIPTINGKMYPYTESFDYAVGDSVRWRVINASDREHPMHLHGFFYRVDALGDGARDTTFAPDHRWLAVTENLGAGSTMSATWSPDRPGNWIFHCHILFHVAGDLSLSPPAGETHGDGMERMSGIVIPLHVRPAPGGGAEVAVAVVAARSMRLLVQARPKVYRNDPGFGFVLQEGDRAPAADSIRIPGSPIVLTQGEPVRITIVNRLEEATAIHWHGIELTSYYDGVPGMSGEPGHLLPSIPAADSFDAIYTPPRAGTFIYHTHIDDVRQMESGLYGPLIVLPPGQVYDSTTDHTVVISLHEYPDTFDILLNGSTHPDPMVLRAGVPNRIRIVTIPSAGSGDVVLLSDSSVVTWRAMAKDGADLPPALATERLAKQFVSVGETYDFEVTPVAGQSLRLELRGGPVVLGRLPIEVR